MGFVIMLFSAILGLALIVVGGVSGRRDRRLLLLWVPGIILIAIAVWLGWPK